MALEVGSGLTQIPETSGQERARTFLGRLQGEAILAFKAVLWKPFGKNDCRAGGTEKGRSGEGPGLEGPCKETRRVSPGDQGSEEAGQ